MPSSLNIGHWLQEDHNEDDRQCWIEAYACSLKCMAEASMGQSWTMEGETMVPQVSSLVETFMAMTGTSVPPHVLWQCWPTLLNEMPVQNVRGIKEDIVCRLDEVVRRHPSTTVWDRFVFPQTDQKYWWEEILSHYPGKVLNIGARMPGFRLMLQNEDGHYRSSAHTLKFEGSMFIYDPQKDIAQWVPVWGVSASLTMVELRSANDLHNMIPSPYEETEPVWPPSPTLMKGVPAGAKLDTDSLKEEDSGEEWDKKKRGNWSHCCSLPLRVGLTWAEVHAVVQEWEVLEKNAPTWEDIISKPQPKKTEEEKDSYWEKDNRGPVEFQFKDAAPMAETDMDTVEESTAEAPQVQDISEASVGPGSQDMVQIHTGMMTWNRSPPVYNFTSLGNRAKIFRKVITRSGWLLPGAQCTRTRISLNL